MIPKLYGAGDGLLTHNGLGLLTDTVKATVTEERNGAYELSLQYPITGQFYSSITEGSIIKAKPNDTSNDQLFRIYKSSKPINGIVTFYAEHISYDLNGLPLTGFTCRGVTPQAAIYRALTEALFENNFSVWSDIATLNETDIKGILSIRELLGGREGSVLDVWGGEYEFDNYTIKLHSSRGADNGVSIEYRKNLTNIKQDVNITECYTHIAPYAIYTRSNGSGSTYESAVYLTEEVIALPNAPNLGHNKAFKYDCSGEFSDGEIPTEAKVRTLANKYIANHDLVTPKVNITVSFVNLADTEDYKNIAPLERVSLCDTVTVKFPKLGVSAKAKVIKTVYDVLREKYNSVTIGDAKSNFADTINKQKADISRVNSKVAESESRAAIELQNAIARATAAITGQSGGYVVLNPAENPQEILILDADSGGVIEDAVKVWRWNSGGLGYSSSGYDGEYSTAITMNGEIVADFITAGTLSGNVIQAGTVTADAISAAFKQSITDQISGTATTLRQEFAAADGELRSSISSLSTTLSNDYSTTTEMQSAITQSATSITSQVSQTLTSYSTTSQMNSAIDGAIGTALQDYSTTTQMQSAITQSATSITSQVSQTLTSYSTTSQMNDAIDGAIDTALQNYSTTTEMQSAITQTAASITTEVNKKVNNSELGTKIEQNYSSVKIAWNQSSDYIQFENGELNIYSSAIHTGNKLITLNQHGINVYRGNDYLGEIGNAVWSDGNTYGLNFLLNAGRRFMSWAAKDTEDDPSYTPKLFYTNTALSSGGYTYYSGIHLLDKTYAIGTLYLDSNHRIAHISDNDVMYNGQFSFGTSSGGSAGNPETFRKYYQFNGSDFNILAGSTVTVGNNVTVNVFTHVDMKGCDINNVGQITYYSDVRAKENLAPSQINALNVLNAVDMYEYNWIKDDSFVPVGIIAQQLQSADPYLVKNSSNGQLSINATGLVNYLVKAVQELSAEINTIKKSVGLKPAEYTKKAFNEKDYKKYDYVAPVKGTNTFTEDFPPPLKLSYIKQKENKTEETK